MFKFWRFPCFRILTQDPAEAKKDPADAKRDLCHLSRGVALSIGGVAALTKPMTKTLW